jgi:hypothetical protein
MTPGHSGERRALSPILLTIDSPYSYFLVYLICRHDLVSVSQLLGLKKKELDSREAKQPNVTMGTQMKTGKEDTISSAAIIFKHIYVIISLFKLLFLPDIQRLIHLAFLPLQTRCWTRRTNEKQCRTYKQTTWRQALHENTKTTKTTNKLHEKRYTRNATRKTLYMKTLHETAILLPLLLLTQTALCSRHWTM